MGSIYKDAQARRQRGFGRGAGMGQDGRKEWGGVGGRGPEPLTQTASDEHKGRVPGSLWADTGQCSAPSHGACVLPADCAARLCFPWMPAGHVPHEQRTLTPLRLTLCLPSTPRSCIDGRAAVGDTISGYSAKLRGDRKASGLRLAEVGRCTIGGVAKGNGRDQAVERIHPVARRF